MSYRKLFCLFTWFDLDPEQSYEGYTLIYKHTFPNDEPPYISVTYFGIGKLLSWYPDDGEFLSYYLIRDKDAELFIAMMNEYMDEYCGTYLEGVMTRNFGEHNLNPREYCMEADWLRKPKVKYFNEKPKSLIHVV